MSVETHAAFSYLKSKFPSNKTESSFTLNSFSEIFIVCEKATVENNISIIIDKFFIIFFLIIIRMKFFLKKNYCQLINILSLPHDSNRVVFEIINCTWYTEGVHQREFSSSYFCKIISRTLFSYGNPSKVLFK